MSHTAMKITGKWQFTIPTRFRSKLKIRPGDYLEPEIQEGVLVLKPRKQILIDPDQDWFWTKEWQEKELEVEEEIKNGRTHQADSIDGLLKGLK